MFQHRKLNLQHMIIYGIAMLFLMVVLPLLSIKLFPGLLPDQKLPPYTGSLPEKVKVYITDKDRFEKIPFEKYIEGVVASEMPASFEYEALKAQAVASRTYALGRINAGTELCDSVHCQVYRSDHISKKVKKAVRATSGQVLLHNKTLAAHTLYFSSSAGNTENSEDVFTTSFPYLVSVSSSYEPGATHKDEKVTLSLSDFAASVKAYLPDKNFGKIKMSNIEIISLSEGGRVSLIKVGRETISGADIRNALSLYSSRFKIAFKNNFIIFTTEGSGHGVGMSQYGANGLAKKGRNYQQILTHYYKGTVVSK